MGFYMPDEDAYWERVREEYENPKRWRGWEDEPIIESESVFLDEELEEIENEYGCTIQELFEADLMEIVEKIKNIIPISAKWNEQFQCIDFKYEDEEAYA